MPNIQQYEAGDIGLRPTEIGVESTAQAARRAGAFYNQAAESKLRTGQMFGQAVKDVGDVAVEYATHQDKSQGSKVYADGFAALTAEWEATKKAAIANDPNDPTVAAKFMKDRVEPFLDKFQQGFFTESGQKWGENMSMRLREHLTEKTTADMSLLSGLATAQNVEQGNNKYAVGAFTSPDMHTLAMSIEGIKANYAANIEHNVNLKAEVVQKLKEAEQKDIGKAIRATVLGASLRTPELGEKLTEEILKRYPEYVDVAELSRITTASRQDQRYNRALAKQEAIQRSANNAANVRMGWFDENGNFKPDPHFMTKLDQMPDERNEKGISKTDKSNLATIYHQTVTEEKSNAFDPNVYANLQDHLLDVAKPTTFSDILAAEAKPSGQGITNQQATHLITRLREKDTAEGEKMGKTRAELMKRLEPSIDAQKGRDGTPSALGQLRMQVVEQELMDKEKQLGANWRSLYDPKNVNYYGNKDNIEKHRASLVAIQEYQRSLESKKGSKNIGEVIGVEVQDIPKGMSPADVIKNYRPGTRIKLPDGSVGVVPGGQ